MKKYLKYQYVTYDYSVSKIEPTFREIIVEKSLNSDIVKEIVTGLTFKVTKGLALGSNPYDIFTDIPVWTINFKKDSENATYFNSKNVFLTDDEVVAYKNKHIDLEAWKKELMESFDIYQDKYYKCRLSQVTEEQGYIKSGKTKDKAKFVDIEDLIVEKTFNPFYVRELVTGLYIPILKTNIVTTEYNDVIYSYKVPFGPLDTFVNVNSYYHEGKATCDKEEGLMLATVSEVEEYQKTHDKERWFNVLHFHFLDGTEFHDKVKAEEKFIKINNSEEKKLMRYLNKKNNNKR